MAVKRASGRAAVPPPANRAIESRSVSSAIGRTSSHEAGGHPSTVRMHESRDMIFSAAMAEFSERGFRGATIASIAQRAGVSRMTVYKHVEGKDQLLEKLSDYYSERLRLALQNAIDDSLPIWEVLMEVGRSFYEEGRYAESRAISRVLIIEAERMPNMATRGLALRETCLEPRASYFTRLSLAGIFATDNAQHAAQQFLNLTTNSIDYLFEGSDVQEGEREKYLAAAVKTFLYGVSFRREGVPSGLPG